MKILVDTLWDKLSDKLLQRRAIVLDLHFINLLVTDYTKYQSYKRTRNQPPFKCNKIVENVVKGLSKKRLGKTEWLVNVDKVYAPMNWNNKHWVALCINLVFGIITIFSSAIDFTSNDKVIRPIQPMVEMMHPLITVIFSNTKIGERFLYKPPSRYTIQRPTKVTQNVRSGDCGPLTVKYMEMHAMGKPLFGSTEEMVDNIRMRYAMDVYENYVQELAKMG